MPIDLAALAGGFAEGAGERLIEFGLGAAIAEALRPEAVELGQEFWKLNPGRAVDAMAAAAVVAEDVEQMAWGAAEAAASGIDGGRFAALVGEALNAPGVGELLALLRRDAIDTGDFAHGLRKSKLETRWDGPLAELRNARLSPQELAIMVQRSIVANPGLLPVTFDNAGSNVTPMPQVNVDPVAEAKAFGIDHERLAALARIVGLPPAPGELLQLLNRGVINEAAFRQGISEGNTRNEWADVLVELRRRLLTPHEYAELRLRGWIDDGAMHAGAALSGMTTADTDLLRSMIGRPLSFRQVFIGERRGGHYNGGAGDIDPAFLKALQESDVRPEWYSLAWAQRFSYPAPFVIRTLATSGELTEAETLQILLFVGWEPTLAGKVSKRWTQGAGGATKQLTLAESLDEYEGMFTTEPELRAVLANLGYTGAAQDELVHLGDARRAKRYREQVVAAIAKAYTAGRLDDTAASSELAAVGVTGQPVALLLRLWRLQRLDTVRELTPAQIVKGKAAGLLTDAEAQGRLTGMGYSAGDAVILLTE